MQMPTSGVGLQEALFNETGGSCSASLQIILPLKAKQECTFSAGVGLRPVQRREGCCAAQHITPWSAIAPLSAPLLLD